MMAPGENRYSNTTMRQMPVLAQSQYPALDPNYFINGAAGANSPQGNPADNLFTPGLDLPSPNLATVNLPSFTERKPSSNHSLPPLT